MAAERELTEHIATLTEKNSCEAKELADIDRGLVIAKRLEAISESVSFHSEFLRYFSEMHSSRTKKEESSDEIVAGNNEVEDNRQNEECTNIKDAEADTSCEAEHSSGDIGQQSHERNINNAPSVRDSPDSQDQGSLESDSPDAQSEISRTTSCPENDADVQDPNRTAVESRNYRLNIQYCYEFNLFSTEYLYNYKLNKVKKTNDDVLLVMPYNFNALWNRVKLMIAIAEESGDCIDDRAEEILNQLEQTVSQNGKQMLIAKAEIAAMYTDLSVRSDSLNRCIRLYEEVLAEAKGLNQYEREHPLPEKLVVFWKCILVRAYAMLTNANKVLLAKYGFHHGEVLSRLEELVLAVDYSGHIANHLKAQTWVNLANTFEHFRQNYPAESFRSDVCSGLSISDLLAKARKYDPDNPRILMRSGRELRQRATSEQELTEAINLLKRALNGEHIDDIRDVIYHHIGLAYKALWIHTQHPVCEEIIENTYKCPRNNMLPRAPRFRPPHGCLVIKPPDHPLDFNLIPIPYKKPPRSAFWKVLIPIASDPEHTHLLEAIKCFEYAIGSCRVAQPLYLLEIARIYSSTRNIERAREYFQKTLNNAYSESVGVDFIGVSLFETLAHFEECEMIQKAFKDFQSVTHRNLGSGSLAEELVENLAHFEESEMIRLAFRDSERERVKSLYRESIRFSTISKTKTVVAFYYILRILYKQLSVSTVTSLPETDQMILQNEYFLLYMAIQEAKQSREIVNSLTTNDVRIAVMWRLVDMFNRRNQQYDASAAFTYLNILAMANKLTTEVRGINFTAIDKQRMLLLSAERVAQQRVAEVETRCVLRYYKQLCDLEDTCTCEYNSSLQSEPLTELEIRKLEIVNNIMRPEFDPGYLRSHERC